MRGNPWFDGAVLIVGLLFLIKMIATGYLSGLEGLGALIMFVLYAMFRFFKESIPWRLVGWLVAALFMLGFIGGVVLKG